MQQILDALRTGATADALSLATAAVAAAPDDAQAHRVLALAQRASGDVDGGRASIERAIALAPDDADLHFLRAGFLLGAREMAAAAESLATTISLDPNQFGAYVLQAQLAVGRGELDEAERLARLAARIAPGHPWLTGLEGTLALRRGDADGAIAMLTAASQQLPDDPQLRYALGMAYLAKGHHAFAEQAFRGVLERTPEATTLRSLIASLLQRQGRPGEAADELAPLFDDPATSTPALHRHAGELDLAAGRHARALEHLRAAFAAMPEDRRTLSAIMEAWRRNGDPDEARTTLDAALAAVPAAAELWRARLALEAPDSDVAADIAGRWRAAMPQSVAAHEARMSLLAIRGDDSGAEAVAQQIVELEPGHGQAQLRLIDGLLQRDPPAAIAHIEGLLAQPLGDEARRLLRGWLALAHDRAGDVDAAAAAWLALHAEVAEQRLPLPEATPARQDWPEAAVAHPEASPVAFLVGAPGSLVDRLALVLGGSVDAFRADRLGANPPDDALQNYRTPSALASGELDSAAVAASWEAQLPARGIRDQVVDWLLWWDNALAAVLRERLPQALLVIAMRDPRDMLLDWLAFGGPVPFRIASVGEAASWLAGQLEQVALLHEQDLVRHRLVRLDDIANDPEGLAHATGEALGAAMPAPPRVLLGAQRFAPGHWRAYAGPLGDAFGTLAPVARRLGYPDA